MEFNVPAIKPKQTDKIGLIDADYIKYYVIHNMKSETHEGAMEYWIHRAMGILNDMFTAKGLIFCFSGYSTGTYRNHIAIDKKYKGNRDTWSDNNVEEDKLNIYKYIKDRYPTLMFPDLEADDIVSMLQDEYTFVFSEDKDLLQVPGTHWNIKGQKFYEIEDDDAFLFLMRQMLEGDVVDNIPGLKGCGSVGSYNILTNIDSDNIPCGILGEYIKANGVINGLDRFVENWNLLKLRVNRGDYFQMKYKYAFDTLKLMKQ